MPPTSPAPLRPRRSPVTQLVDAITAPATPAFKAACKRGAGRRGITLAEFTRLALSERLAADGVRHRRPDGSCEVRHGG